MKIGIQPLQSGIMIRWPRGLGLWANGFLLPTDNHFKTVFDKDARKWLEELPQGLYEDGKLSVGGLPPGPTEVFPFIPTHTVGYAVLETDVGLVPGKRLLTQLGERVWGLVLTRIDRGQRQHLIVNAALSVFMDLGEWYFQGPEPDGPIVIQKENFDTKEKAALHRGNVEAVVWPMDVQGWKE